MNNKIYISMVCAAAISLNATDIGKISVESSTIDDKFDAKKMEVSNTATISGTKIEEVHSTNIAEVLNSVPGLTVRQNEGDSNKIHIRGIAGEMYMGEKPGVAIVIDGVPVQERAGSVNIDSDNIESIKIIKGGASYLYGNDALAGAVIITTKRPKAQNEGSVSAEAGSYGYKKYLARYNASTENFAVQLQGSKKSSDGYWDSSDYWAKSFNGKFQYYIDDSSDITLGLDKSTRFENDSGSLTAIDANGINQIETNPTSEGEVGYSAEYDIALDKYFLTYAKNFENDSNLMTQIYKYEDTTTNKSARFDTNRDGIGDDHKYNAYNNTIQKGLKSEYRIDGDKIASMIGIDIARNESQSNTIYRVDYTSRGRTTPAGTVNSDTYFDENINALYGEVKYQINNKITTSFNARLDQIDYDFIDNEDGQKWDTDFNEYSYKIGATYKLKENSIIYTNTSTGFRVPTITQLYAGDFNGYGETNINNLDIDTEKTYNYEVGYRGKVPSITYDVAIYQLNRDDVIGKSSGNYSSPDVETQYENMADIQNRGLEITLNSDNKKTFSFGVNYTYLDSKYTRYNEYNVIVNEAGTDLDGNGDDDDYVLSTHKNLSGNAVPRTSKHTINVEGNYKAMDNLLVSAEVNYRSSQYADDLNNFKVDGYSIVNLRTKYNTKLSGFPIEFFAKIDNILDEQFYMMPRVTSDRNDDGVLDAGDMGLTVNPGRTYLAGMSVKF
ncbi:MAG: TonB-dependent receptor [Campylobacterota bacterium]|nr:TonB-dependent receptor [Campylobacterota bacterium]